LRRPEETDVPLAGVLTDVSERTRLGVELYEERLSYNPATHVAAEILGFDLLTVANEGEIVFILGAECAERSLALMRRHALVWQR